MKKSKSSKNLKVQSLLDRLYTDEKYAQTAGDPLFPTSINREQGELLASWVEREAPRKILELGFGYGVAALWIELRRRLDSEHTIVDHLVMAKSTSPILKLISGQKKLRFERKHSSQEFLALHLRKGPQYDFIFLDADLRFEAFLTDMYFITKVLNQGGVVVIRNMWNPSIRKGIMYLVKNLPYKIENISVQDESFIKLIPYLGARKLEKLL